MFEECPTLTTHHSHLTLEGLRLVHERTKRPCDANSADSARHRADSAHAREADRLLLARCTKPR